MREHKSGRTRSAPILPGLALAGFGALMLLMGGCASGGHFTILGYTTRPNYDTRYKTVRVKIFKNPTFWAVVPVPGLEMQLTQAIVREIEAKTPYKVVQGDADTELTGSIVAFTKGILNYNQLFEVREAETSLLVQVAWRDLKTGYFLTIGGRRPGQSLPPDALAAPPGLGDGPVASTILAPIPATPTSPLTRPGAIAVPDPTTPGLPPPGAPGGLPVPPNAPPPFYAYQLVRSEGYFRPELGESISTAQQRNVDHMAIQIISMMESPW